MRQPPGFGLRWAAHLAATAFRRAIDAVDWLFGCDSSGRLLGHAAERGDLVPRVLRAPQEVNLVSVEHAIILSIVGSPCLGAVHVGSVGREQRVQLAAEDRVAVGAIPCAIRDRMHELHAADELLLCVGAGIFAGAAASLSDTSARVVGPATELRVPGQRGVFQPPTSATSLSACGGPQLPCSYS